MGLQMRVLHARGRIGALVDHLRRGEPVGDAADLVRRAKYSDVRNDQGFWTAHTIEMEDLKRQSRTVLKLEKLQYNVPMKDEDFTVQALRREQ